MPLLHTLPKAACMWEVAKVWTQSFRKPYSSNTDIRYEPGDWLTWPILGPARRRIVRKSEASQLLWKARWPVTPQIKVFFDFSGLLFASPPSSLSFGCERKLETEYKKAFVLLVFVFYPNFSLSNLTPTKPELFLNDCCLSSRSWYLFSLCFLLKNVNILMYSRITKIQQKW